MTGLLRVQSIYPNWLTPPELKAPSADTSVRKSYRVMYKTQRMKQYVMKAYPPWALQATWAHKPSGTILHSPKTPARLLYFFSYAFFQKATFRHQLLPCSQSLQQLRPVCIYDHGHLQRQTRLQRLSSYVVSGRHSPYRQARVVP